MPVLAAPTDDLIQFFINEPVIQVAARAEIFESDGVTPFMQGKRVIDGQVTLDWARDERRMLDITLENTDRAISHPGNIGYDKIVKVWRGIIHPTMGGLEFSLGEFLIDNFAEDEFPHTIQMSCRDFTKRLLKDKFPTTTTFVSGQSPEEIIKVIAVSGGISKLAIPATGKLTTTDHSFERGVPRWQAIKEIAGAYGYEVYFSAAGYLTMELMADPATTPPAFTFRTGEGGTLTGISRKTNDERLYNHIVVTGEGTVPPIYAVAENNDPQSDTRIEKIGRRTYEFVSQFFTNEQQAQETADKFLKIHSLENYEVALSSRVLPWLEVGRVARFVDPTPDPGAPEMFMFDTASIPLRMGQMDLGLKRVVLLG